MTVFELIGIEAMVDWGSSRTKGASVFSLLWRKRKQRSMRLKDLIKADTWTMIPSTLQR